jgi:hypothetical protein
LSFTTENARRETRPYWWVDIEGLPSRYGTLEAGHDAVFDAWNPAVGAGRHIYPWLMAGPKVGAQNVDPFKGTTTVPQHTFEILDYGDAITNLCAVSDSSYLSGFITIPITAAATTICIDGDSYDDVPAGTNTFYIDRETITSTGKATATSALQNVQADWETGITVVAPFSTKELLCLSRTEGDGFFVGGTVTINGETRTIEKYFYDENEDAYCFVLSYPLSAEPVALDTFDIGPGPRYFRTDGTSAAGTYTGAQLGITSGTCSGENTFVQSQDASGAGGTDRWVVEPPLSKAPTATTDCYAYLHQLTGCTRGLYGSTAAAHTPIDEFGVWRKKQYGTRVPFLATRRVTIYENRVGCAEADALRTVGYIESMPELGDTGTSYIFTAKGILSLLGRKVVRNQYRAQLAYPLWGGYFAAHGKNDHIDKWVDAGGGQSNTIRKTNEFHYIMADGRTSDFTISNAYLLRKKEHLEDMPTKGNVMIEGEICHFFRRYWRYYQTVRGNSREIYMSIDFGYLTVDNNKTMISDQMDLATYAGTENRGVLSEQMGKRSTGGFVGPKLGEGTAVLAQDIWMPTIAGLMREHEALAEVKPVLVCTDTPQSDFARYDRIGYENRAVADFAVGDTIFGQTGQATATVVGVEVLTATTGVLTVINTAPYQIGEGYFDSDQPENILVVATGANADVVYFEREIRHRNDAISVVLQMLMSSGTPLTNGKYDTLPTGFGLGLTTDQVDVAAIEEVRDRYFTGCQIDFCIDETVSLKEWLEKNVFNLLQVFALETRAGKISLACLMTQKEAEAVGAEKDISQDCVLANSLPAWNLGREPLARLTVKYNKIPGGNEWGGVADIHFDDLRDWYEERGRTVEIQLATLYMPLSQVVFSQRSEKLPAVIKRLIGVLWDRMARFPCPEITVRAHYADLEVDVGDIVTFSHLRLPNMRTGARGMASEYFQVIGREPRPWDGTVSLTLLQIGVWDLKYGRRAPSGLITAVATDTPIAGQTTVTIAQNEFSPEGEKDIDHFAAGDAVSCFTLAFRYPTASHHQHIVSVDSANNAFVIASDANFTVGNYVEYSWFSVCVAAQYSRVFSADDYGIVSGTTSAYKFT